MKKIYYLLLLCFCLNARLTFAQTISLDDDKRAGLKGGISYLSNNVFMGRTDTVTSKVIAPQLLYTFKSGFYVSGTLSFILNQKQNTLDGSGLEAGYNYEINDDLYGGVSFSKYFYGSNSTRITSAISSIFNAYLNYDLGDIITPELSVSYSISSRNIQNDIFVTPGIMHQFSIDQVFNTNYTIEVDPEVSLNTGTQNFYNGYFSRRRRNITSEKQLSAADQQKVASYTLLDYEAQLPVKFKADNFLIALTPSLAFPQNKLPNNINSKLANKRSLFYFEASILFKF